MSSTGPDQRGFTLLEVLIAVGIFALLGLVATVLLTRTLDARSRIEARADRLQEIQRGLQRLERDAMQYLERGVRDEFGDRQLPLAVSLTGTLTFTTQGWRNPLQLPRSELQRVRWRVNEQGALERGFWAVLDLAQDSRLHTQSVIANVQAFDVEVIDDKGKHAPIWPRERLLEPFQASSAHSPAGQGTPIALRISLQIPPFGRIERLLLLGEAVHLQPEQTDPLPGEGRGAVSAAGGSEDSRSGRGQ